MDKSIQIQRDFAYIVVSAALLASNPICQRQDTGKNDREGCFASRFPKPESPLILTEIFARERFSSQETPIFRLTCFKDINYSSSAILQI